MSTVSLQSLNSYIMQFMDQQKQSKPNKKYRKIGPYLLSNVLGRGAFSTVYQAKKEGQKKLYAVKQISLMNLTSKQLQRIHSEIKVLTLIKHQNIISLVEYKQTSHNLYLVFEYCQHTDLQTYIEKYCAKKMPEEKVRKIAIQIKNAFKVLRAKKVVHRDLKLANVLVTDDFQIKIADFGFAKHLDDNEFLKSYVGTPLTMAPQILQNQNYNQKCDLWSLGIIIYQMLFGKNPFFNKDRMSKLELQNAIKSELIVPNQISEQAEDLLRKLIVVKPAKRISFDDFFRHPWLCQSKSVDNLNQDLLEQALRYEIKKTLLVTNRKKEDKQFLQSKAENLLAYQLIQNVKNTIESKFMYWINLGKKIMSLENSNKKLNFLSICVLIQNLEKYSKASFALNVNEKRKIILSEYSQIRKLQKWEMSQYSKRLPGFIERSILKMKQYNQQVANKINFSKEQQEISVDKLFLLQLLKGVIKPGEQKANSDYISIMMKIKGSPSFEFQIRVSSNIFSDSTIDMLLQKLELNIENNKMYKKCQGIFKLDILYKEEIEDKIYENIQTLSSFPI